MNFILSCIEVLLCNSTEAFVCWKKTVCWEDKYDLQQGQQTGLYAAQFAEQQKHHTGVACMFVLVTSG